MPGGEGRVCPYCEGKGYVSVEVHADDNQGLGDMKTLAFKDCPLCGGRGVPRQNSTLARHLPNQQFARPQHFRVAQNSLRM